MITSKSCNISLNVKSQPICKEAKKYSYKKGSPLQRTSRLPLMIILQYPTFSKNKTKNLFHRISLCMKKFWKRGCFFSRNCYNSYALIFGGVAQLGERTVRIRKVESSILFVSTKSNVHLSVRSERWTLLLNHVYIRRRSSAGQSACFTRKRSTVRARASPLKICLGNGFVELILRHFSLN